MRADFFDITIAKMKKKPVQQNIDAARAVMVDGLPVQDAANKFGANRSSLSRVMARIAEEWEVVSAELGLVPGNYALRPAVAALVEKIQEEELEPILRNILEKASKSASKKKS